MDLSCRLLLSLRWINVGFLKLLLASLAIWPCCRLSGHDGTTVECVCACTCRFTLIHSTTVHFILCNTQPLAASSVFSLQAVGWRYIFPLATIIPSICDAHSHLVCVCVCPSTDEVQRALLKTIISVKSATRKKSESQARYVSFQKHLTRMQPPTRKCANSSGRKREIFA